MSKGKKSFMAVGCVLAVALVVVGCGLFRGRFDHGKFEIKGVSRSSSGYVAQVAERSDSDAMSSYVYFVLVADHELSPVELRSAYHSDQVIFAAASDCLSVRWSDPHNLTISCPESSIDTNHINVQRRQAGDVTVNYVNIPNNPSMTR